MDAGIAGDEVVEALEANGLGVTLGRVGVEDLAIPKGVVGENESAGAGDGQDEFVILVVDALVGIDEDYVEGAFELRNDLEGIAKMKVDQLAEIASSLHHVTEEVFEFVKDLDGVKLATSGDGVGGEGFGHREGAVAAVSAQFEDAVSTSKLAEHLEQSSLKVARTHAWIGQSQVSKPLYLVEQFGLSVNVGSNVFVECIVEFLVPEFLFHRSTCEHFEQSFQGESISIDAKANDDAVGNGRNEGVVAELFARVDVRDVYLDGRDRHSLDGIVDGNGGVGIGTGVEDNGIAERWVRRV